MATDIVTHAPAVLTLPGGLPALIERASEKTAWRFVDFFTATIRNVNTREAYARAVARFLSWCEGEGIYDLQAIWPVVVAAYIETFPGAAPSVKQHLAASVRGPKYVIKKGKTPVLSSEQATDLIASIDPGNIAGLRDRALIGAMVYTFARVSAVTAMKVEDYYKNGRRYWFRLHEKDGKFHEVSAHHKAEDLMEAYLEEAKIKADLKGPLFRSVDRRRQLTDRPMHRNDVIRMIKRRGRGMGLPPGICCHTFRATGITDYLENGGTIEKAQAIAAHESPRTTKLYDRTADAITLAEIERIRI